jgi:hypothetical protein
MPESKTLKRKLGMTRRDLLRRGIIVGGSLVWTVPVIQSLTKDSSAQTGSPQFFCCFCTLNLNRRIDPKCFTGPNAPQTAAQCAARCRRLGYRRSQFVSGPNPITCVERLPIRGGGCRTST